MEKLRPGDPEQLGPYRLIARLGSGGMGVVFLGSQGSRRVAVKVVRSSFLDNPSLRTRFEREIETLKKLKSKHVAAYLDSDVDGELAWHAVEFVNGPTLREQIEHEGPMSPDEWWAFYENLQTALSDIHALGITHRDLKPSNIILSETGIKLIDFGIAQDSEATSITTTGTVTGSPAWLSPEHLEGTELGPASDLFAAGSILVYAAKGTSPWGNETTMTVPVAFQRILSLDLRLDGLNPEFEPAVRALLVSDAASRSFIKGGPTSNNGVPGRGPSENAKDKNVVIQLSVPSRGPSVPARPSFTRPPEQAPSKQLTEAGQPSGQKRGRFLIPAISLLVVGAAIATGLYIDSATEQAPTPSSPSATEVEDTKLVLDLADPETLSTVRADSWPGRWVGSAAERGGTQWMFSEFRPTAVTKERGWELENEPLFSAAYNNSEPVNYAVVRSGQRLARWRCLDEAENLAAPQVRVPGSGVWIEVGTSEVREVSRCASGSEGYQEVQFTELKEFVGAGNCAVLRFKNRNGPVAVGCAASMDISSMKVRGSLESLLKYEPMPQLFSDDEIQLVVAGDGWSNDDISAFSLKVPLTTSNPVESVRAFVTDEAGKEVTYRSNREEGTGRFLGYACPYGFDLDRQPSASKTARIFVKDCGASGVKSGNARLEIIYENGSVSSHTLPFTVQEF